jgi:hypothetical protein
MRKEEKPRAALRSQERTVRVRQKMIESRMGG